LQTAILRAAGLKPERDFTLASKGTFLEGLEIAFIVVTFGSAQGNLSLAATGAALALVVMGGIGLLVRAPLSRVPENTMKFAVGVLLTTFTFWSAQGAGAVWPGQEASLLALLDFMAAVALALVSIFRQQYRPVPAGALAVARRKAG
jgi:uncharacterized membrane protein